MLSPYDIAVRVREILDAHGMTQFNNGGDPDSVDPSPMYSDASIQMAMDAAKRDLWRLTASNNLDWAAIRSDTFTYPANTEFVRLEPPNAVLGARLYRMELVEDMTNPQFPVKIRRTNWQSRTQNSSAWGAFSTGFGSGRYGIYGTSGRAYAERAGNFYLLPGLQSSSVPIRITYVPHPSPIDVQSKIIEQEIPEPALDWFIVQTAINACVKFGVVPPALQQMKAEHQETVLQILSIRASDGPMFGQFTRN
jgi:hypothetical protein